MFYVDVLFYFWFYSLKPRSCFEYYRPIGSQTCHRSVNQSSTQWIYWHTTSGQLLNQVKWASYFYGKLELLKFKTFPPRVWSWVDSELHCHKTARVVRLVLAYCTTLTQPFILSGNWSFKPARMAPATRRKGGRRGLLLSQPAVVNKECLIIKLNLHPTQRRPTQCSGTNATQQSNAIQPILSGNPCLAVF